MTDLWTMAGEEAERDAAAHKLALARVACACYWPVLATAADKDGYEHAKALISEGVTASVAGIAVSPADQAILASLVLDSFDEDWDAHQAAQLATLRSQGAFTRQHYEAIAQTLKDYQTKNSGGGIIPGLAEHWADRMGTTSPLFNKERFVHAVSQGDPKKNKLDMPLLTQQHYEAIADAIASGPVRHRQALATHFANTLRSSNVKFKPDLFMRRANPTAQERGRGEGEGSMANPGTGRERSRAHQVAASRTAVVENAPDYGQQMGFGFPAEPLPNEAPELENEIAAWEGSDRNQRVQMGNGIGVADDSAGPNVEGPGQNQGEDPLLHASALDIEAGLAPGDYRLDAFGALIPVVTVRHTAPGGGEHAPYYVRREGDKFKVVNRNGDVKGTFNTKEEARSQQKALYANVEGASEEAEKRHGETPKAVEEEGKKASRHQGTWRHPDYHGTDLEMHLAQDHGEEVDPEEDPEITHDSMHRPGSAWGDSGHLHSGNVTSPTFEEDFRPRRGSLQMTALQRQAVQVARKLVDGMPAGVEHHAVAKAMLMRARGFELNEDETDLIINAALQRVSERLDFTKEAAYDNVAADLHGMNHGDRTRYESEGHAFEVSYHERPAFGDMGQPVPKSDKYSGTTGEYTLYHPHGQAQEFHVGPSNEAKGYQAEKVRDTMMDTWSRKKMNRLMGREGSLHITAEGVSEEKRDRAEKSGDTLPGTDKFPITNKTDLENAKHDIGRTSEPHDKVVNYINRKADELGAPKVGEEKTSRLRRLWSRVTGRRVTAVNIHHFDSSSGSYARTQTDENVKDGDVFHIPSEQITGYMHSAWPVAVTENKGQFHGLNHPDRPPEGEEDKTCPSCGGSGQADSTANAPYRKEGDTSCWHCGGKGLFPGDPPERVAQWKEGWGQARDLAQQKGYPLDSGSHEASRRVGQGGMTNPMDPASAANPFSPTQDVNSAMTDTNPDMGQAAGTGAMGPATPPPDEIPGQTQPGSATGTAASSKPRTKPSENPNAPNKPQPMQPQGMPMAMPGQMMTGLPMMSSRAQVLIAESILENNPGLSDDEALHLAAKTIERYPHVVKEAYGGSDYPFDSGTGAYSVCSQCGVEAFDSRTGHCHNCGFVNGAGRAGWDPLSGPSTIRPGRADLRNPALASSRTADAGYHTRTCRSCGQQVRVQLGQDFPQDHADGCPEQADFPGRKDR
jgi:hypothetical protein